MYFIHSINSWKSKSLIHVWRLVTPWTIQSMEFSRSDYWSGGVPFPGDLPNPGIKAISPTLQAGSLTAEPQGKPTSIVYMRQHQSPNSSHPHPQFPPWCRAVKLECWEGLGAGGEGDDRGWDGWMASLTRWTWVWVNSGSWWWTGRPGVLQSMGLKRVGHDWATELKWTYKVPL